MIKKFTLLLLAIFLPLSMSAKMVYTGEHNVGSWNALQLTAESYPVLTTASEGDVIAITISEVDNARITLQTTAYGSLGEYDEYNCNEGVHYFVLTESAANEVKTNGLNVSGEKYTLNKVELLYKKTLWSGELNGLDKNWEQSDELSNSIFSDLVYGVPFGVTVSEKSSTSEWNAAVVRINYASNVFDMPFEKPSTKVKQLTASDVKSLQTQRVNIVARYLVITELNTYTQMKQEEGTVAVSIGEDGIATFSYSSNLSFENTGITPYYASSVSVGTVNLTPMTTTWGWQGYILKGDPGIYYVPTVDDEHAQYPAQPNYLQQMVNGGDVAASTSETFHYIFAKDNTTSEIGFYKLVDNAHTLAAHKAYLETDTDYTPDDTPKGLSSSQQSVGSKALIRLSFGGVGGTTAINTALKNPIVEDGLYYTLQGVAVKNPSKGIYILNGKKVFVK